MPESTKFYCLTHDAVLSQGSDAEVHIEQNKPCFLVQGTHFEDEMA